jgi:uncharacterized protein (DUF2267 family)
MQFDEFVGEVQHLARLGSTGETMRAIAATMETLGERLYGDEADNLGAQLPYALAAYLRLAQEREAFGLDEFFQRVAEREGAGVDLPDAAHHVRVVMAVLEEAVTPGEWADARAQLPDEWEPLFEAGATGEMQMES